MRTFVKLLCVGTLGALLTACGGGSDSTPNVDPQGYWQGTTSTGYTLNAAVLDNGEVWGIYSSGSTIYGALYGTSTVSGKTIKASGADFDFVNNTSIPWTVTGPVVAKSTMSLTSASGTLPLTYQAGYDIPATSAALAGTWSTIGRSGSYTLTPASVSIDSSGNFSLVQSTCTTTGSAVPRPGGKNLYNISLTTSGTGCAVGQSSLAGVLTVNTSVTPNQFIALALTPNKADGLVVIGTKQ